MDDKLTWEPPTLDIWLKETVDSRRWLIKDFIPADGLVLVSGQQKRAMKTFSTLTMMLSLATGKAVSLFNPVEAMPVLFVEEEGSRSETRERILGIARSMQIVDHEKLNNVHFSHRDRVKVDATDWRNRLVNLVKAKGIQVVFLDALTYMHHADENKTNEMTKVIETLQELRAAGATVVSLVHTSGSRGEDKKADIDSQVRGSTVVCNAYDIHLAYRRYNIKDAHIDLTVRGRSVEEKYYSVAFDIQSHDEVIDGSVINILDQAKLSMVQKIEGDISELVTKCIDKLLPGVYYSGTELRTTWKLGAKNMKDVLEAAMDAGTLVREGDKFVLAESQEARHV